MKARGAWILASCIAIVLVGAMLWLRSAPEPMRLWAMLSFAGPHTGLVVALGLGGLAIIGLLAAAYWSSPWNQPIFAALGVLAPLIPGIATVATAALYLAWADEGSSAFVWEAVLIGFLVALYAWWLIALVYRRFVTVQCANPRVYRELSGRLDELNVHLEVLKPLSTASLLQQSAYGEACAHRDFINQVFGRNTADGAADTGFHWVFAIGYIDLWNRLHRAEEALLQLQPIEAVVAGARYDQWRLQRSGVDNRDAILARLDAAVKTLTSTPAPDPASQPGEEPETSSVPEAEGARAILREIRHTLNTYRDGRWEGLVRVRNRLIKTGTFTSLFTYLLLGLAIVAGAGPQVITAAAAFYLVGVSVGLFNQLLGEAGTESAIEDYGLASTRLLHIPLFSGFAAVGGVVLMTLLPLALAPAGQSTPSDITPVVAGSRESTAQPAAGESGATLAPRTLTSGRQEMAGTLRQIFDLQRYPMGLVIAAIFGLTPRLLIDGLKSQTDRYSQELRTTQATTGMQREEN